ncbi:MAG TPA: hypothetical protein VGM03_18875 [Phycisphaerae bacterium]|jgi:hypothetical protein
MARRQFDPEALAAHAALVREGLKEAIRQEVAWRQRMGLPIIVQEDGRIIDLQTGLPPEPLTTPTLSLDTEPDEEGTA